MSACLLLASLGACSTARKWQELKTGPLGYDDVYDAVELIAKTDGLVPQVAECDRGLGTWTSCWRERWETAPARPARYRLLLEITKDKGSTQEGWPIRYVFEQQRVKDLTKSRDPQEDDWSKAGQDEEKEALFGARLSRRLHAAPVTGK